MQTAEARLADELTARQELFARHKAMEADLKLATERHSSLTGSSSEAEARVRAAVSRVQLLEDELADAKRALQVCGCTCPGWCACVAQRVLFLATGGLILDRKGGGSWSLRTPLSFLTTRGPWSSASLSDPLYMCELLAIAVLQLVKFSYNGGGATGAVAVRLAPRLRKRPPLRNVIAPPRCSLT